MTDQVLVVLAADAWLDYQIIGNGNKIKLEPSIIGAQANNYLKIYKRKIGPDPGSINSAKIGVIIANKSSWICLWYRKKLLCNIRLNTNDFC